eukprot:767953-Hanusia_phi.AAC.4
MWSDPEDIEEWSVSPRGAGWLFGSRVTAEFCDMNGLELVCRAHQLVQEGFKYMFPQQVLDFLACFAPLINICRTSSRFGPLPTTAIAVGT